MIGNDINKAADILRNGGLVAVPTETVYGLAANALDESAISRIYIAKGRPSNNPLILHLATTSDLDKYVHNIPEAAWDLLEVFSPGPLTLVLPKRSLVPDIVTANSSEVAIRVPAHPTMKQLILHCGFPLAAPSANASGYISPTHPSHVIKSLAGKIDYVLDGGACKSGIESTIVGFREGLPVIFREGIITRLELEKIVGPVGQIQKKEILAPGMSDRHYSPKTTLLLSEYPEHLLCKHPGKKIGVITYGEFVEGIENNFQVLLGNGIDLEFAAKNLYAALHEMDEKGFDFIIAKKFPSTGIGIAINDRLTRASTPVDKF